jgi:hypothetical protein
MKRLTLSTLPAPATGFRTLTKKARKITAAQHKADGYILCLLHRWMRHDLIPYGAARNIYTVGKAAGNQQQTR